QGCHNAAQIYREIVRKGYPGSSGIVRLFVATLRSHTPSRTPSHRPREPVVGYVCIRPKQVRKWFTCPPDKLGEEERRLLERVLEVSPAAREAYGLLQAFRRILAERKVDALRSWLEQAAHSSLAPLRGFAKRLERDLDAVMN